MVWGAAVIADSAQLSAALTEATDIHYVGTALTIQTALGFSLTIVSIQGLPLAVDAFGWRAAMPLLALGPFAGGSPCRDYARWPRPHRPPPNERSLVNTWPNGRPEVGQHAERTRRVSRRDIELFTEITGDHNPLHYDEAAAAASPFGEIIVQGGITSGVLNALVAEDLPGPGTVFLKVDWNFTAPVRPGDEITGMVKVLEARDDKPITKLRTTVTRDDGTIALEGTALCFTAAMT